MVADKIQSSFLDKQFAVHFPFLEDQVKTAPGVEGATKGGMCGKDFSAADILMSYGVVAATDGGVVTKDKYPELVAYVERIKANEAYKRAGAKTTEIEAKFSASL